MPPHTRSGPNQHRSGPNQHRWVASSPGPQLAHPSQAATAYMMCASPAPAGRYTAWLDSFLDGGTPTVTAWPIEVPSSAFPRSALAVPSPHPP